MLIGIDASRAGKKERTGTEWYSYHLLNAMSGLPCENAFRLYVKDALPFALPHHWQERRLGWPFDFLWTQAGLSLEMLVHPPDVLFVPSHAIPLIHPHRTVTTIHDIGFCESPKYRSRHERRYLEWSTRYALSHCSRIITVSEFTKQELVRVYAADPSNIVVVHHGVDTDYWSRTPGQEERTRVLRAYAIDKPYLLFVGRIDGRKNIETLVRAFELVLSEGIFDGLLVLAGPIGYDGAAVLGRVFSSQCARNIRSLGWVSEEEKRVLMHAAGMFVFPSLYEGFGLPVIEAQSCGTPVVCSGTTSLPEIAGDGALYVDPVSPEDIARGIRMVLGDTRSSYEYSLKGLNNAKRFSWERCARETLAVLESQTD
ncbi:glycosyltransferase family 4 protein [Candidatus Uhrbacteria bacterium]|nr:glycosyltransferase family 4 protein [Candidatus Uhrbacteria bacterium]